MCRGSVAVQLGLQLFHERIGFIPGELATGLTLSESHRASGIAKITVPGSVQQLKQLVELLSRCRWTGRLTKGHAAVSHALHGRADEP